MWGIEDLKEYHRSGIPSTMVLCGSAVIMVIMTRASRKNVLLLCYIPSHFLLYSYFPAHPLCRETEVG
jgi:TRAP-type uncharacterized transport system fused permease subunit